jgi:hypothetical protein
MTLCCGITSTRHSVRLNIILMSSSRRIAGSRLYVPRKGEVNAWDNEDFVKTVRATGRKTLIMAGVWTSVCVMFPALDAKAAGFKVYVGDRCIRRSERIGVANDARALRPGRRHPHVGECGVVRDSPHVEPSWCRWQQKQGRLTPIRLSRSPTAQVFFSAAQVQALVGGASNAQS